MKKHRSMALCAAAALALSGFAPAQDFEVVFEKYVMKGDPAPNGDGIFDRLSPPRINDDHSIVFTSRMTDTSSEAGIFYMESQGALQHFLRINDSSPTGVIDPFFIYFNDHAHISNAGALGRAFYGFDSDIQGLYTVTASAGVSSVLEPGNVVPGLGTLYSMDTRNEHYAINNEGQFAVGVEVNHDPKPNTAALIRGNLNPLISPTVIFAEGDPAPEGNGQLWKSQQVAINDDGAIVFEGYLVPGSFSFSASGLYVHRDGTGIENIFRTGDSVPDSSRTFGETVRSMVGGGGEVLFLTGLHDPDTGILGVRGLFKYSNGVIQSICQTEEPSPIAGFNYIDLQPNFMTNASGTVAFACGLSAASGAAGGEDMYGAFRVRDGIMEVLAVTGDPVPGTTDRVFGVFYGSFLNDNDDVVFLTEDVGPIDSRWTMWIADSNGALHRLVTKDDEVQVAPGDVRTIQGMYTYLNTGGGEDGRTYFLNDRTVGAHLRFNDGTEGIFTIQLVENSGLPEDVNNDGSVDVTDLLALLGAWGPCGSCDEDIDGNGTVNVTDLLSLLAAWGQTS